MEEKFQLTTNKWWPRRKINHHLALTRLLAFLEKITITIAISNGHEIILFKMKNTPKCVQNGNNSVYILNLRFKFSIECGDEMKLEISISKQYTFVYFCVQNQLRIFWGFFVLFFFFVSLLLLVDGDHLDNSAMVQEKEAGNERYDDGLCSYVDFYQISSHLIVCRWDRTSTESLNLSRSFFCMFFSWDHHFRFREEETWIWLLFSSLKSWQSTSIKN